MVVKLTCWGEIDIQAEIAHVSRKDIPYTKAERKKLIAFYQDFEAGKFRECAERLTTWTKQEREYVQEHVLDCLRKVAEGTHILEIDNEKVFNDN